MEDELGELVSADDAWRVVFTRRFAHPLEKVWRAITEPEHLAAWFPDTLEGDIGPGARLRFVVATGDAFDGEVRLFEPPNVLELRWGDDIVRIDLVADGDVTVMTFADTIRELGKAARDAAGWHECLARLRAEIDGTLRPPDGAVWRVVHPRYQDAFGSAASAIGPPS
jgi:uncharacterized protein YndB with AHSA1/START domain